MQVKNSRGLIVLGLGLFAGLALLGYQLSNSHILLKRDERTVTVKGLSEREMPADVVIWPISFSQSNNALDEIYQTLDKNKQTVINFLKFRGFNDDEISVSQVKISDRHTQGYNENQIKFRYNASQRVVVYSPRIGLARRSMAELPELGKQGVATIENYDAYTEFLFTKLNEIKPQMIEESTKNARLSAEIFAADSQSKLGKIKHARQGQFTIHDRDTNTPHIKKVRVVSTIEYYLVD
ncbi:MAG: SIMPL domain-containing protein [Arenicellales bacterium]